MNGNSMEWKIREETNKNIFNKIVNRIGLHGRKCGHCLQINEIKFIL